MENLKFKIFLLQQEDNFIKSELDKEQQIIEKQLNIIAIIHRIIIEIITPIPKIIKMLFIYISN